MNDEDLIGYLLGACDPVEHEAIKNRLRETPETLVRLEQLKQAFLPLESIRDTGPPPAGLADRTIARLAIQLARLDRPSDHSQECTGLDAALRRVIGQTPDVNPPLAMPATASTMPLAPREEPETRSIGGRFRLDLIVACAIAFFACGLVLSAISKVRARSQLLACQSNLQTMYVGLAGYADTHDGHYPQIAPSSTADSFATTLQEAGQVPAGFRPGCPAVAVEEPAPPVSYTYSLGFRTSTGSIVGLRRSDACLTEHDLMPISADYPTASAAPAGGPFSPHLMQMNVLFLGGQVRVTTSPFIGPNGDDIYRNVYGQVAAGINQCDVVLGRPGDRP